MDKNRKEKLSTIIELVKQKGLDKVIEEQGIELCRMELSEKEWKTLAKSSPQNELKSKNSFLKSLFFKAKSFENKLAKFLHKNHFHTHPEILENDGKGMRYIKNTAFENWDDVIHIHPKYIFFPRSKEGLQNLIKWTRQPPHQYSIRAAGYSHTSTSLFSDDGEVLISMLDPSVSMKIPTSYPPINPHNNLQGIQLVGDEFIEEGQVKHLCRIGAATCNYHFQDWVHDKNGNNYQWAIPFNVVLTEITFGGGILMMCHGAGAKTTTLADLVTEIEYIDIYGNLKKISDPKELKVACSFGILGVVTAFTVKLDKMSYANLQTAEVKPTTLLIPPPEGYSVPKELDIKATPQDYQQALADFSNRCENHYYSEWFWFPLQKKGWVNSWNNDGKAEQATRYPGQAKTEWQRIETYLVHLANTYVFQEILTPKQQACLFSSATMFNIPDKKSVVCTVEDGEHFRQGIHNLPTKMCEFQIKIPRRQDDPSKYDFSICQKLWWDVINCVYDPIYQEDFPLRTTLEMRIIGGSDMLMAPNHGNELTCAIEVLTPVMVKDNIWKNFVQQIINAWSKHKNPDNTPIIIRPHWAKRHIDLTVNGQPISEYLQNVAYKDEIPAFNKEIENICEREGYPLDEIKTKFTNAYIRNFFWEQPFSKTDNATETKALTLK